MDDRDESNLDRTDPGVEIEFTDGGLLIDGVEVSIQDFARAAMDKVRRHEQAIYALQKHRTTVEIALEEVMACLGNTTYPSCARGEAAMLTGGRALGQAREARNTSRGAVVGDGSRPFVLGDVISIDEIGRAHV